MNFDQAFDLRDPFGKNHIDFGHPRVMRVAAVETGKPK